MARENSIMPGTLSLPIPGVSTHALYASYRKLGMGAVISGLLLSLELLMLDLVGLRRGH